MITCTIKQDRPIQGQRPLRVTLRCSSDRLVDADVRQLNSSSALRAIKISISGSVIRAYGSSGLNPISGALLALASGRFEVSVSLTGEKEFEIMATWEPGELPYFEMQLFGGQTPPHEIRPRSGRALWWSGIRGGRPVRLVRHPGSRIPPHDFIRLDRQVESDINALLRRPEDRARPAPTEAQVAAAKRIVGTAEQIARGIRIWTATGGRLTLHQLRRILRGAGVNETDARFIAPEFLKFKRRGTFPIDEITLILLELA